MRRRHPPSPAAGNAAAADDLALFRAAVADAVPLAFDRVHHEPAAAPPIPRQRQRDEAAALAESLQPAPLEVLLEGGDELAYLRSGLPRSLLRDLRRGRWVCEDQLDLHGLNRHDARAALAEFVAASIQRGLRCLRVIHGKGRGSPGREPVLKELVRRWLAGRDEVLAYCQTLAADGGSGAVAVLLKAKR